MSTITVANIKAEIVATQLKIEIEDFDQIAEFYAVSDHETPTSNPLQDIKVSFEAMLDDLNSEPEMTSSKLVYMAMHVFSYNFLLELMRHGLPLTSALKDLEAIKESDIDLSELRSKYEEVLNFIKESQLVEDDAEELNILNRMFILVRNQITTLEDFKDVDVQLTLDRQHGMYEKSLELSSLMAAA